MKFQHGGNLRKLSEQSGLPEDEVLDFSANMNPLGMPEWTRKVINRNLGAVAHYPDPECTKLICAAAKRYELPEENILAGNGSNELLYALLRHLPIKRAVIPCPSYIEYERACNASNIKVERFILDDDFVLDREKISKIIRGGDVIIIGSPNNPTGLPVAHSLIRDLATTHEDCFFIIDEAFADFQDDWQSVACLKLENVIALRSLTKIFAIPGIRLGLCFADKHIIEETKRLMPEWSVNSLAQVIGTKALADTAYLEKTRANTRALKEKLVADLRGITALKTFESSANFLLIKIEDNKTNATELANKLIKLGIAIRVCNNYAGLNDKFFRIAVRTQTENNVLLKALRNIFSVQSPAILMNPPTPSLMLQGTSSNAGKSVLTAALCRILLQDGYNVAPFKSQNMALNSFVTADGKEMGRAQVVQAQACRLAPDVRMNPVLLKPNSDTGSQVIVNGVPLANMNVREYTKKKAEIFNDAKAAYDSLSKDYDVIILEGAGSPGEVNLKKHDIVNMRMAEYAKAKVLLAGDIDRGGVYASFVGTMNVLDEWERKLVGGFLVNRFRGDATLLKDAHDYVFDYTGVPVIGVIPNINDLGLPEEDSVSFKNDLQPLKAKESENVSIAIVDLPHISNFTDFDAFHGEPDVNIIYARKPEDLKGVDAIILPGSKNVIADLREISQKGMAEAIKNSSAIIVGICGGLQMLGDKIHDPQGVESSSTELSCIKLLPISTTMSGEKTLQQVATIHEPSGKKISGYEIHHGQTTANGAKIIITGHENNPTGFASGNGKIWGTYIHGIFDSDEFRRWFIDDLRVRKGLAAKNTIVHSYDIDASLDRLADVVRQNVDMKIIYKMMGIK